MASMKQLGLDTDDYIHYIRGEEMEEWKVKAFDKHWLDDDLFS